MNSLTSSHAALGGEIFPPDETVAVTAFLHPLKLDGHTMTMAAGSSIADIIAATAEAGELSRLAASAHVELNGHVIPQANWHRIRVKAGAHVMVRAVPGGGLGNILRTVLMIALSVVAYAIAGRSWARCS